MRRWFLSYHSPDFALAERLAAAIEHRDHGSRVFLAAKSLRAGGAWQEGLAREIAQADAFILLVGASGIGPWQVPEYNEAHDRSVKDRTFPLVLVGGAVPRRGADVIVCVMVKSLEVAIAEVASLPDADQKQIGRRLLSHVEKLRQVRAEVDEGIRSIDAGKGKPVDIEEFLRRMNERHGRE
jgi:hypothetical protein